MAPAQHGGPRSQILRVLPSRVQGPRHLFQKHQGNDLEGPEVSSSNLYVSVHILHDWFFSETKLERRNQMAWRGERLLGFNIGLREGGKLDPPREKVRESTWGEDP